MIVMEVFRFFGLQKDNGERNLVLRHLSPQIIEALNIFFI